MMFGDLTDETFAVAHVEFRSPEHKARAERLRSSTCHAFQMALGCPVELKLSLECPPSVVLEEIKASHVVTHSEPSMSETANVHATVNAEDVDPSAESPPHDEALPRQRGRKPKSRQEMLTGLAARSRRLGDAGSRASLDSRDNIREYKYCFPMECVARDAAGSSRRHRLGRRPSLNRVPSGRRENLDGSVAKRVSVKWRYPKFKGIANLERRKSRYVVDMLPHDQVSYRSEQVWSIILLCFICSEFLCRLSPFQEAGVTAQTN